MNLRLDQHIYELLEKDSHDNHRSVAGTIRHAVHLYLFSGQPIARRPEPTYEPYEESP